MLGTMWFVIWIISILGWSIEAVRVFSHFYQGLRLMKEAKRRLNALFAHTATLTSDNVRTFEELVAHKEQFNRLSISYQHVEEQSGTAFDAMALHNRHTWKWIAGMCIAGLGRAFLS